MSTATRFVLATVLGVAACGGDDGTSILPDATGMDVPLRNGCPQLLDPLAMPGDPIDGDTFRSFARGFFREYCIRCHSTTRTGDERNGAPEGRNWDDESSVRAALELIRFWVGEINTMPIGEPRPTCEERARMVRWIDAGAP